MSSPVGRRLPQPTLLTLLTPVTPGAERRLLDTLAGIAPPDSPFAALPGLHFANFVVVGPDADRVGTMLTVRRPLLGRYLLVTAAFDGPRDAFVEAVRTRTAAAADAIWGCCVAYPGSDSADAFHAYLRRNRIRIHQRHVGVRGTVGQIREALDVRRRHRELARRTLHTPDTDLLDAFATEFGVAR